MSLSSKAFVVLLSSILIFSVFLVVAPSPSAAANYQFSVAEERLNVTVNKDGSVNLDYYFNFVDVVYLDGADIGMPNTY